MPISCEPRVPVRVGSHLLRIPVLVVLPLEFVLTRELAASTRSWVPSGIITKTHSPVMVLMKWISISPLDQAGSTSPTLISEVGTDGTLPPPGWGLIMGAVLLSEEQDTNIIDTAIAGRAAYFINLCIRYED